MKFRWPWGKKKNEEEISSIETMLESLYTPVTARPAFVDELRNKLTGVRGPLGVASRSTLELILLIGGAVIGLLLFVAGAVRAVLAFLAGIKLLGGKNQEKRKTKKSVSSSQSTNAEK
jgi:hypothetical protein